MTKWMMIAALLVPGAAWAQAADAQEKKFPFAVFIALGTVLLVVFIANRRK